MSRFLSISIVVALTMINFSVSTHAQEKKDKRDPAAMFKRLDADSDGKLTAEEFKKLGDMGGKGNAERLDQFFKRLDADKDGSLTLEEFKKFTEMRKGKDK